MKRISLTIGIPAYNEEANIAHLLTDIANQKQEGYILKRVIVCSDASTDKTVDKAQNFLGLPIGVIVHKKRTGKAGVLNSIFQKTKTDALVIVDADTHLGDPLFIAKLVKPIATGEADLCAAKLAELPPETFFENLLAASMLWKRELFQSVRNGNNVYTCYGRARAFSNKLYRTIQFKESANEDAYSYLFCAYHKLTYQYVADAILWYRLPQTLKDHKLQSVRFFQSRTMSDQEFGKTFVTQEYALPKSVLVKTLITSVIKHPVLLIYFLTTAYLGIQSKITKRIPNTWTVAKSSKVLKGNMI